MEKKIAFILWCETVFFGLYHFLSGWDFFLLFSLKNVGFSLIYSKGLMFTSLQLNTEGTWCNSMQISFILGLSGLKKLLSHEIQSRPKMVMSTAVNLRCHQSLSAASLPSPRSRSALFQREHGVIVMENPYLWFVRRCPLFPHCLRGQITTFVGAKHTVICISVIIIMWTGQQCGPTQVTSRCRSSSRSDWLHPVRGFKMSWTQTVKIFFLELFLRKRSH